MFTERESDVVSVDSTFPRRFSERDSDVISVESAFPRPRFAAVVVLGRDSVVISDESIFPSRVASTPRVKEEDTGDFLFSRASSR